MTKRGCTRCRNIIKKQCIFHGPRSPVFDEKFRFSCEQCSERKSRDSICSTFSESLAFYATDFIFKHAFQPCNFCRGIDESWCGKLEHHVGQIDTEPDEADTDNHMFYFYTEDPQEYKAAWSPLYVRKIIELDKNVSSYQVMVTQILILNDAVTIRIMSWFRLTRW